MTKKIFIFAIVIVFAMGLWSQAGLKPVLKKGDVKKFIKSFPQMVKDMQGFGMKLSARQGTVSFPEAMRSRSEVISILKKHGWDESFYQKLGTIIRGFGVIKYGLAMHTVDGKFARAAREIENNTSLSDEMKKQLLEQMKMSQGMMKKQSGSIQGSVNPLDLKMIRAHVPELEKLFEEEPDN